MTLLGLLVGVIGTNFIKDYISTKTKDSMNEAIKESIDKYVQPQIDTAFATPNIKKLIENKAKEYTEKNAKHYIETKVDSKINPFIRSAELKIAQIDISVLEAKAFNDDREAYDKLVLWNKRDNNPNSDVILKRLSQEYSDYSDFYKFPNDLPQPRYAINDKLTPMDSIQTEILFTYLATRSSQYGHQMSVMFTISKRPKADVLKYALSTLKTSKSIKACVSTSNIIMYILKKQGDYMDFDNWINVIEKELSK